MRFSSTQWRRKNRRRQTLTIQSSRTSVSSEQKTKSSIFSCRWMEDNRSLVIYRMFVAWVYLSRKFVVFDSEEEDEKPTGGENQTNGTKLLAFTGPGGEWYILENEDGTNRTIVVPHPELERSDHPVIKFDSNKGFDTVYHFSEDGEELQSVGKVSSRDVWRIFSKDLSFTETVYMTPQAKPSDDLGIDTKCLLTCLGWNRCNEWVIASKERQSDKE